MGELADSGHGGAAGSVGADAPAAMVDRERWPYKMKDLCRLTGLPRQVIHFYIQQGLLPEGHKTGRNMAYYGEEHVERVRLIRQLQHERFLPLKAIRAMFDAREDAFSPAQRSLLRALKHRLPSAIAGATDRPAAGVDADELLARAGLSRRDLDEMVELGLLGAARDEATGRTLVARDDAWMIELYGEWQALGLTRERGFSPRDLAIYDEAMTRLFEHETALLTSRLSHLPPEQLAAIVERTIPLINTFMTRYHATKIRNFFAAM